MKEKPSIVKIMTSPRFRPFVLVFISLLITLHFLFYISSPTYKEKTSTSISHLTALSLNSSSSLIHSVTHLNDEPLLANATFVALVRNSELYEMLHSLRALEDRFNKNYHYPIVFLNDVPFDDIFIERTKSLWSGETYYGLVPDDQWGMPEWIDRGKAIHNMQEMEKKKIIYGGSESYRNMCRYQSGFFYKHPLLQDFKWYWRVEPGVEYYCDINYDPFKFMEQNNKTYGFTISMHEISQTIPTLWDHVNKFAADNLDYIEPDNAMPFLTSDGGRTYNRAHFWSNFEIGSMDFWRSKEYTAFFDYLDKAGGFYYERWGDAPVHSIAACLFLQPEQLHYFEDIGYKHGPYSHCPDIPNKCYCNPEKSIENNPSNFANRWLSYMDFRKSQQKHKGEGDQFSSIQ